MTSCRLSGTQILCALNLNIYIYFFSHKEAKSVPIGSCNTGNALTERPTATHRKKRWTHPADEQDLQPHSTPPPQQPSPKGCSPCSGWPLYEPGGSTPSAQVGSTGVSTWPELPGLPFSRCSITTSAATQQLLYTCKQCSQLPGWLLSFLLSHTFIAVCDRNLRAMHSAPDCIYSHWGKNNLTPLLGGWREELILP